MQIAGCRTLAFSSQLPRYRWQLREMVQTGNSSLPSGSRNDANER